MQNEKIADIISRQSKTTEIRVISTTDLGEAVFAIFEFEVGTSAAVVYPDEVCFTLSDWQDAHPESSNEINEYDWYDHENGIRGVVLNGLPRVF